MAPKKAAELPPPPVPTQSQDPAVAAQQARLDKWSGRVQQLQLKLDGAVKSITSLEAQITQSESALVKLQEQATEMATKKFGPLPGQNVPQATAGAAPSSPKHVPSKSPRGGKGADPAPTAAAAEPPSGPTQQDIDDEIKRRNKISNALLNLYKKKRTSAGTGATATTPRETQDATQDNASSGGLPSPSAAAASGESFTKPADVPAELWAAMLGLREEKLAHEEKIVVTRQTLDKHRAHANQVRSMLGVGSYAIGGSEREIRVAMAKAEEKRALEQAAKEAAVREAAANAAAAAPSLPKKK